MPLQIILYIQWLLISLASAGELVNESSEEETLARNYDGSPPQGLSPALGHHVLVAYSRSFCSGSIIHSKVVLTVASCFLGKANHYGIKVKFAVRNYMDSGPSLTVVDKKEHEFYQYKGDLDNDIALLILNDVSKSQENSMMESEMQVIGREECDQTFPKIVSPSMFCTKFDLANRLSDNGGAAVYKGMVVGLASYGANLMGLPHIALFTNVSYFYKWIKLNTERLLLKHCSHEEVDVQDVTIDY